MRGRRVVAGLLPLYLASAAPACRSRPEAEKSSSQIASALAPDVSPLDLAASRSMKAQGQPWDSAFCQVVPEPDRAASFSDLTFEGTCSFHHRGPATCRARGDDYYAIIKRRLADGNDLDIYLNVEFYTGPGDYDGKVEILALVQRGQSLYRWSNMHAKVTLGYGEGGLSTTNKRDEQGQASTPTLVQLPATELGAEPGTMTSGTMTMRGTIGCVLKKNPE